MMTLRQRLACSTAPIFLRLALAVVFLFAGIGKLNSAEFSPEQAAQLANMGVAHFAPPATTNQQSAPAQDDAQTPPAEPSEQGGAGGFLPLVQTEGAEQPEETQQPAQDPPAAQSLAGQPPAGEPEEQAPAEQQTTPTTPQYAPDDYAGPMRGRQLFLLALELENAAHPADGGRAIWPASLARGGRPAWIAWAVTLVEIAGGVLVLVGALTRLAGLALAGVMVGALWLASIGPYLLGGQSGWAGFLPPMSDFTAWQMFLLQLTAFAAGMALFCAGSGSLSVDRLVFGSPGGKTSDEDDEV